MSGQSQWPAGRSPLAAMSARTIAVMAVLRSGTWPGSQDPSRWCGRPGACRAVCGLRSLVMVVSVMVRVMAVTSGCGSWFGFPVRFRVAGAFEVVQEFVQRRWSAHPGGPGDHEVELGTVLAPGLVAVGDQGVVGVVLQLEPVFVVVKARGAGPVFRGAPPV